MHRSSEPYVRIKVRSLDIADGELTAPRGGQRLTQAQRQRQIASVSEPNPVRVVSNCDLLGN